MEKMQQRKEVEKPEPGPTAGDASAAGGKTDTPVIGATTTTTAGTPESSKSPRLAPKSGGVGKKGKGKRR